MARQFLQESPQLPLLFYYAVMPEASLEAPAAATPMVDPRLTALQRAGDRFDTLIDDEMGKSGPNVSRTVRGLPEAHRQSLIQAVSAVNPDLADKMSRALSEGSPGLVFDLIRQAKEQLTGSGPDVRGE